MGDIDMPEAEYVQNYSVYGSVGIVPDAASFIHIFLFQLHAFLSFVFVQCFGVNMKCVFIPPCSSRVSSVHFLMKEISKPFT